VSVETVKMRIIKLNPDFIVKAIQGKTMSFVSNLPADSELLHIKYDLFDKEVLAIVRSDSFEDTADSYPLPELNITFTSSVKPKTKLEPKSTNKPESKPIESVKPENRHREEAPVSTIQDTRAVEEEFSPEQRDLLSFTADGDYVIIKPTQYLKAEWNEINEIVKSLGGKWVKGDFYSYWEIPPG